MADPHDIWSPAKVFSPSAARQQSSQAKDWTYVTSWLTARYHPNPVPPFERNPATLKTLLSLATANEAADEEKSLELRLKQKTLSHLHTQSTTGSSTPPGEHLLSAVEDHLTPDATRCLNSIALLSVALSTSTDSPRLASQLLSLSKQEYAVSQQVLHINALLVRLHTELESVRDTLRSVEVGKVLQVPPELSNKATEWARTSRVLKSKAEDYRERLQALEAELAESRVGEGLTVPTLVVQEREIAALKEHVLSLEAQARGFQGLPPEKDLARMEVERVEAELQGLEAQRERLYDRMTGSG